MLGTKADIQGQEVRWVLGQLYARQERYFILEVEVMPGESNDEKGIADVSIGYRNMVSNVKDSLASNLNVRFSDSKEKVEADTNVEALAFSALQLAAERNREATALRDAGKIEEARKLLELNAAELGRVSVICKINNFVCTDIEIGCAINDQQAKQVGDEGTWNVNRKRMREYQNTVTSQQSYGETGKNSKKQ
jgi:Ca-activated chloride channel family protein